MEDTPDSDKLSRSRRLKSYLLSPRFRKDSFWWLFETIIIGGVLSLMMNANFKTIAVYCILAFGLLLILPWPRITAFWLGAMRVNRASIYIVSILATGLIMLPITRWTYTPLNKYIESFNTPDPYNQIIQTATADMQVTASSNETASGIFMSGAIFYLYRGATPLLTVSATQYTVTPLGNNKVLYHATCTLDPLSQVSQETALALKQADHAEIIFITLSNGYAPPLPVGTEILSGKVIIAINGNAVIKLPVPSQTSVRTNFAFIPNVETYMSDVK